MADLRTIGWFMLILYKPNGGLPTILLKPCSPSLRPRCCFTDIHQLLKHADATDGGISILGVHEAWALTTGQPTHEAQEEQNVDPEERITCQAAAAGVSSRRLIIADGDGIASPSEGLFLGETVLSLFRFDVCQLSAGVKACIFFHHECHDCHAMVTASNHNRNTPKTTQRIDGPRPFSAMWECSSLTLPGQFSPCSIWAKLKSSWVNNAPSNSSVPFSVNQRVDGTTFLWSWQGKAEVLCLEREQGLGMAMLDPVQKLEKGRTDTYLTTTGRCRVVGFSTSRSLAFHPNASWNVMSTLWVV